MLEECLAQGGDEVGCNRSAAEALHACFTEHCSDGEGDDDCEARCEARWLAARRECLDAEPPHDVCVMLAGDVKRACLEACGAAAAPGAVMGARAGA